MLLISLISLYTKIREDTLSDFDISDDISAKIDREG
jgi:hypothetical protein